MIREFFRKIQLFLMLALGTYPVFALICVFYAPQMLDYVWRFSATFAAAGCLLLLLPKVLRYVVWVLGCCAFIVPVYMYVNADVQSTMLFFGFCHCGLLLWNLQIRTWDQGQELSGGWMSLWLLILVLGYIVSYLEPLFAPAAMIVRVGLFVYVFLGMCSLNRSSLYLASGGKNCITARMRRNNLLLVLGMFGLAGLTALLNPKTRILEAILAFIKRLRGKMAVAVEETTSVAETIATTVATETTAAAEGSATGLAGDMGAMVIREKPPGVLVWFYILVVVIGIFFVLVVLFAKRVNKSEKDKKRIKLGVEDEITSIRKGDRESSRIKQEKKEQVPGWLSPTKRIRRRYKALADKNPQWGKSSTARENLREEAAQIYEKTRYSSHAVTKQDAEDFKNKTK